MRRYAAADPGHLLVADRAPAGGWREVTYGEAGATADEVVAHAVSALKEESGTLRCQHGDRLIVLYGRGVATVEVAPRGAVL